MVGWTLFKVRDRTKEGLGSVLLKPSLVAVSSVHLFVAHLSLHIVSLQLHLYRLTDSSISYSVASPSIPNNNHSSSLDKSQRIASQPN